MYEAVYGRGKYTAAWVVEELVRDVCAAEELTPAACWPCFTPRSWSRVARQASAAQRRLGLGAKSFQPLLPRGSDQRWTTSCQTTSLATTIALRNTPTRTNEATIQMSSTRIRGHNRRDIIQGFSFLTRSITFIIAR